MTSFRHLKSVIRLNELVEDPYDLTKDGAVSAKRIDSMMAEAVGLKLFYAMERVSETTFSALSELAERDPSGQKDDRDASRGDRQFHRRL